MFLPTHYFSIGTKYLFMLWPYIVFYDDNSLYYYMFLFTQRNVITGLCQYLSMLFKYNWLLAPILITVSLYRFIKVFTHCIYDHIHIKLNNSKTDLRYFQRIDGLLSIGNRASCLRGGIWGTIFFDGVLVHVYDHRKRICFFTTFVSSVMQCARIEEVFLLLPC